MLGGKMTWLIGAASTFGTKSLDSLVNRPLQLDQHINKPRRPVDTLGIDGAWIFKPQIHKDNRGSLHEWFRGSDLLRDLDYPFRLAQANCSVSHRGVVRGIHFTEVPPGQSKYIVCVTGAVMDVAVDLRVGSPTFARWEARRLDDETRHAVFLSEGLGHAFVALTEHATVMYLCSTPYAPSHEHAVHPLDPVLDITWPRDVQLILSAKDEAAPSLDMARRAGLLPVYSDCVAFAAQLTKAAGVNPERTG